MTNTMISTQPHQEPPPTPAWIDSRHLARVADLVFHVLTMMDESIKLSELCDFTDESEAAFTEWIYKNTDLSDADSSVHPMVYVLLALAQLQQRGFLAVTKLDTELANGQRDFHIELYADPRFKAESLVHFGDIAGAFDELSRSCES